MIQIIVAFLIGSIPFGLIVSYLYSVDIRKLGSGNIGATNVYRNLGKIAGIATFIFDLVKGILPILILSFFFEIKETEQCILGLSAILGHCFSPFLGGNGGKGISTSFGVFLYLDVTSALLAFAAFLLAFCISGYVSLGSLVSTVLLYATTLYFYGLSAISFTALIVIFLVFFRHKENIQRLIVGEENSFFKR